MKVIPPLFLALISSAALSEDQITVIGDTLAEARANYSRATNLPRRDCDKVPDGRWLCSSENNPTLADVNDSAPTEPSDPAPSTPLDPLPTDPGPSDPAPTVPGTPAPPSDNNGRIAAFGVNIREARAAYAARTTQQRVDCDRVTGGWVCANFTNPSLADVSDAPTVPDGPAPPTTPPVATPQPTPEPPSTPSNPAPTGQTLRVQTESAAIGGTPWRSFRRDGANGISWSGPEDFRADEGNPPSGILDYQFTIRNAGVYQLSARVFSRINGNGAGDKFNDVWVKALSGQDVNLNGAVKGQLSKWSKLFAGGAPERWVTTSSGEQYSPTFKTKLRRFYSEGTHTIQIAGRSRDFAIDWLELTPVGGNP